VPPVVGDVIKGQPVTEQTIAEIEPDDWPVEFFSPTPGQGAGAIGLVLFGFGATVGLSMIGGSKRGRADQPPG